MNNQLIIQQGQQLCWAACLEWRFRQAGIPIPQASIVKQVKGQFIDQAATDDEIINALNGLKFDYGQELYTLNCCYFYGATIPWVVKHELNNNCPIFVTYNAGLMKHMVVLYQASFTEGVIWDDLHSVLIFDPGNGQDREVSAGVFYNDVQTCISLSINKIG